MPSVSSNAFSLCKGIFGGLLINYCRDVIVINKKRILSIDTPEIKGSPYRITASFFDQENNLILNIDKNFISGKANNIDCTTKRGVIIMQSSLYENRFKKKKALKDFSSSALILKTPDARFELATNGLTVRCSTAELIRNSDKTLIEYLFFFKHKEHFGRALGNYSPTLACLLQVYLCLVRIVYYGWGWVSISFSSFRAVIPCNVTNDHPYRGKCCKDKITTKYHSTKSKISSAVFHLAIR